jgi:hypothetical protein
MMRKPVIAFAVGIAAATATTIAPLLPAQGAGTGSAGLTIAAGRLVDRNGAPVPGAELTMLLWPDQEVLGSQQVGDAVNLLQVSAGRTDGSGQFRLSVPSVDSLLTGVGRDDVANFSLVATAPGATTAFGLSRSVDTMTIAGISQRLLAAEPAAESLSLTLGAVARTDSGSPGESSPTPAPETHGVMQKACFSSYVSDLGNRIALVGQHGSTTPYVTSNFRYSSGSSSTVGVGYSVSGNAGSWSQSGTHTVSSSGTVGFAPKTGAGYWGRRTYFALGKYHITCSDPWGSVYSYYEARVRTWAGGATTANWGTAPLATRCVPQEANSFFDRERSSAVTWSNGFDTSGSIGIDLSIRTGYSSTATATFKFSKNSRLCGTNDLPGADPKILVARRSA